MSGFLCEELSMKVGMFAILRDGVQAVSSLHFNSQLRTLYKSPSELGKLLRIPLQPYRGHPKSTTVLRS